MTYLFNNLQTFFSVALFFTVYAIIISEKIHRTVIVLLGAVVLIMLGIIDLDIAVNAIDFNTIGLLVGMMVIVGIARKTGVFEYLAIKSAKIAKGEPIRIIMALSLITAVLSALLDNVTTVLLIVPVTFTIANKLELNPIPFVIPEILASNVGGTTTLIGDPPNIMIGGAAGLGFMDFIINLAPVIVIVYLVNIISLKIIFRKQVNTKPELKESIMSLDENGQIKDRPLLRKCIIVLAITLLGFIIHQYAHLESSVIALAGASLLMFLSKTDPEKALRAVEWPVIFFFIGLFILVGALEAIGVIEILAEKALAVTGDNILSTSLLILWLSALGSAFIDNIPFVATMIPLITDMGRIGGISDLSPLWWALSLGACLGGNGTAIGATANVVVIGMAEKKGFPITFVSFFKICFPLMIVSIIICSVFILCLQVFGATEVSLSFLAAGIAITLLLKYTGRNRS